MTGTARELSIGQVAELTGLSIHTLRLYEREGLLISPVRRLANGRRVYREWDVDWLANCMRFRASGMPLAAIRCYVELVRQGPGNEDERLALLRRHRQQVVGQIAQLTDCLELIDHKVGIYEEHLAHGTARDLWSAPSTGIEDA
ncbi:MerR family transcriptional regulator [Actinomadura sp. HBU206391]|uniref:MerR family transcriptional regulator n=1 Tax=Actinomadura sp. HBU206391 TaxID=2731692 RepID=UPI00164EE91E|nr:MerR family transcriptional regulator [Actinomadura sp. HBU206391]MBC6460128.1 MerR family transcriptional regulator [Actinomadura sp. HBU206391]